MSFPPILSLFKYQMTKLDILEVGRELVFADVAGLNDLVGEVLKEGMD